MNQRAVLAYSGGLDTSVIVHWMSVRGWEVTCLCLDLGQRTDDLEEVRETGLKAGAQAVVVRDVRRAFVEEFVYQAMRFNALYEGSYPLGTALARPLIARCLVEQAEKISAQWVAHGATGKGNDQVRFELGCWSLQPDLQIFAPWKQQEFYQELAGRRELIAYAEKYGIPVKATLEKPWSMDENLMHISYEAGMLEDPWQPPSEDMFRLTCAPHEAPDESEELELEFESGLPVKLNGKSLEGEEMLAALNEIGGRHGVGRLDMVESRYVGIKSRGVYETPGGVLLLGAHRAMESLTLDRDVINLKDSLMPRFSALVYNGYWYTPEMEALLALLEKTQEVVAGRVRLRLHKGGFQVVGRQSPWPLYDARLSSMEDDAASWNPQHAEGFIRLHAEPLKMVWRQRQMRRKTAGFSKTAAKRDDGGTG